MCRGHMVCSPHNVLWLGMSVCPPDQQKPRCWFLLSGPYLDVLRDYFQHGAQGTSGSELGLMSAQPVPSELFPQEFHTPWWEPWAECMGQPTPQKHKTSIFWGRGCLSLSLKCPQGSPYLLHCFPQNGKQMEDWHFRYAGSPREWGMDGRQGLPIWVGKRQWRFKSGHSLSAVYLRVHLPCF